MSQIQIPSSRFGLSDRNNTDYLVERNAFADLSGTIISNSSFVNTQNPSGPAGKSQELMNMKSKTLFHEDEIMSHKDTYEFSMSYSNTNQTKSNTLSHRSRVQKTGVAEVSNNRKSYTPQRKSSDLRRDEGSTECDHTANDIIQPEKENRAPNDNNSLDFSRERFEEEITQMRVQHKNIIDDLAKNNKKLESESIVLTHSFVKQWKNIVYNKIKKYKRRTDEAVIERDELRDYCSVLEKKLEEKEEEIRNIEKHLKEDATEKLEMKDMELIGLMRENEALKQRIAEEAINLLHKNEEFDSIKSDLENELRIMSQKFEEKEREYEKDLRRIKAKNVEIQKNFDDSQVSHSLELLLKNAEHLVVTETLRQQLEISEQTGKQLSSALDSLAQEVELLKTSLEEERKNSSEKEKGLVAKLNLVKAQQRPVNELRKESSLRVRNATSALQSRLMSINDSLQSGPCNSTLNTSVLGNTSVQYDNPPVGDLVNALTETQETINSQTQSLGQTQTANQQQPQPQQQQSASEAHLKLVKRFAAFREKKDRKKREIANYIEEFEKRENRKFSKEDRVQINHLYVQYNIYKKEFDELEKKLAISTANLKASTEKANEPIRLEKSENEPTMHSTSTSSTLLDDSCRGSSSMNANSKCKSVSPRKAHLAKILSNHTNNSVNSKVNGARPNPGVNLSFLMSSNAYNNSNSSQQYLLNTSMNTSHLNTSGMIDTSAINIKEMTNTSNMALSLPSNGKEIPPDIQKIILENRNLKAEVANLRQLMLGQNLTESDTSLKKYDQKVKDFLKERALKAEEDCSVIRLSTDGDDKKEVDKAKNQLMEQKYLRKIKLLDDEQKRKMFDLTEVLKSKELLIEKLESQIKKMKEELKQMTEKIENANRLRDENKLLRETQEDANREKKELKLTITKLEARFKEEVIARKKLHNIVEDMKGKIRVYCRVRPMIESEVENQNKNIANIIDGFNISLEMKNSTRTFTYDSCFSSNSNQEEVFEDTRKLIQSAVDGFNVCIFAYGQTGSGKTYTMQGTKENPGVTPRAVEELFSLLETIKVSSEIKISCFMIELYKDTIIDLLNVNNKKPLDIKEDYSGNTYITNVTIQDVKSKDDLHKLIKLGIMARKTSKTEMNIESSRSHLIITISLEIFNKQNGNKTIGKLSLVDLAGSERADKSKPNVNQLNEARAINKSLSALGDVISALSQMHSSGKERYIPYRNNKLTLLMKDSLGGTAKTLMFVNVSPADYNLEETQASLIYAARVKQITNDCVKNFETREISKLKELAKNLYEENENLKATLNSNNKEPLKLQTTLTEPGRAGNPLNSINNLVGGLNPNKKFVFKSYPRRREDSAESRGDPGGDRNSSFNNEGGEASIEGEL